MPDLIRRSLTFNPPGRCAAAMALVSVQMVAGCGAEQQVQAASAPAPAPVAVNVAAVIVRPVSAQREFSGRIDAVERAEIKSRVEGTIEQVSFQPGSAVRKGDVLFVIDPRPYAADVARLEAAAEVMNAKSDQAQTELQRARALLTDNAIAQREYDERASAARQAEASARSERAALALARLSLEWTRVRAPFDGRVSKAEVTKGNFVRNSQVLTALVSANPVYVDFNGDESTHLQLAKLARGSPAALTVAVGLAHEQGHPHPGRLEFVDIQLDPQTGSLRLRALVDNKDGLLTPGMFAKVKLSADMDGPPSALVAERAVGTDQNRKFVYVLPPNNVPEYRMVRLGAVVGDLRVVTSGLKAGERVVVDGLQRVRPGAPVTPREVPMDGAQPTPAKQ
jgi:membrane fusion protein, multidrug efflux system